MSAEHEAYIQAFESAGRQRDAAMQALMAYFYARRAEIEQRFADELAAAVGTTK